MSVQPMFGNVFLKDETARRLLEDEVGQRRVPITEESRTAHDDDEADDTPTFLSDQRGVDAEIITGEATPDR